MSAKHRHAFSQASIPTPRVDRVRYVDPNSVRESDLFKASSLEPGVTAKLLKKSDGSDKIDLAMEQFFGHEALNAVDRVRISLDRQTAPKNVEAVMEALKRDPNSEALKRLLWENEQYYARQAAIDALSPQQKARREVYTQQMAELYAQDDKFTRPKPKTNHDNYSTLPATSSSQKMLDSIFSFDRKHLREQEEKKRLLQQQNQSTSAGFNTTPTK
jgi:hypothetical protein